MSAPVSPTPKTAPDGRFAILARLAFAVFLLFVFLVGVRGLGKGFEGLGEGVLASFFASTSNPFVGLVVGILGTTLVQSSSVTTSMVVAMVAAPQNPLPLENAIPMIMGANIGTTVTNTVVALAHMGRPDEFRRAFSAATCHDFFNFLTVAILLPLEIATGFLQHLSKMVADSVGVGGGGNLPNPVKGAVKAGLKPIQGAIEALFGVEQLAAVVLIIVSMAIIFATLSMIVKVLRSATGPRAQAFLTAALDSNPMVGLLVGVLVTVAVQSSSITTSILVPFAGAGLVTLEQVFPITLGSNVGTTVTAILASMAAPSETAGLAVQVAAVHFLFNVVGILLVYPLKFTRQIPLRAATALANMAVKSRKVAILYVLGLFYGLPSAMIAVSKLLE